MSIDRSSVRGLVRAIAYDVRGARIGRVAQVFLDDRTDEPAWVAVDVTRTRGMRLLPLAGAGLRGRHLVIRAERATVRSAPRIDLGDGQLSTQDESQLLAHYGLSPGGLAPSAGEPGSEDQRPASPWPDDTERETAWEGPAQAGQGTHEPPAHNAQDQGPASRPGANPATVRQPAVDQVPPPQGPGGIGDRGINRPHAFAPVGPGGQDQAQASPPGQQRDTAPSPTFPTSAAPDPPQPSSPTAPTSVRQPAADPPRSDTGTQARPAL